jgi:hypothetical protein
MPTPQDPSYREIPLTKGKSAIVDHADFDRLSVKRWHTVRAASGKFYARREMPRVSGKRSYIYMHREVMGLENGNPIMVDHIEPPNTLDNRRSNLRIATSQQNRNNQGLGSRNTSGFKGVTWSKSKRKFRAMIMERGKYKFLGYFDKAEDAGQAYRIESQQIHGEFSRTT